ncbi:YY1-associated factor 2-like [Hydractinia symbiolongicarpus]|uniref:YY1-associated factor 2-like n=1 Tax=Hydractinia symbiolongicarpus TaxID=13093 RepID=UPI00254EF6A5|nr:YY1-associated factor 2-like [Hydractinia symbiolongicarpus]
MDDYWECSVCTVQNKSEAFKCEVCNTRKGTSTRKPRVTASFVAQQIASSFPPIPPLPPSSKYQRSNSGKRSTTKKGLRSNLKFSIDKSSAEEIEITVDDVTVVITDYKLLPKKIEVQTPDDNEINPKKVQIAEIEQISPKEE